MPIILHITTEGEWQHAEREGTYECDSIQIEGFIHCSTTGQVTATASRYYRGQTSLVLLVIDTALIKAPVRFEPPAAGGHADSGELFPHIYGPLNLDAVRYVVDFPPGSDGSFTLPASVSELS